MCPACATPVVVTIVSDDELRGEDQLAPVVPILPSRAASKLALHDESSEQLEEAGHTGARTWTMPGDGADAEAVATIAARLAV